NIGDNRGLLIQPSNAGVHNRTAFSVVPEAAANLQYLFNEHVRCGVGYSFLYWTQVGRPANQIDRAVNIQALQPFDQIGVNRPELRWSNGNFWAHGLNAKLEFAF